MSSTLVYVPEEVSPPGETVFEALEERGMTQADLAERTGHARKTINAIIQGTGPITAETALQFESVFGIPAGFWMAREQRYREYIARLEQREQLRTQIDWLEKVPVKRLAQLGWINQRKDKADQVLELLAFYGVASALEWQTLWNRVQTSFRKPVSFSPDLGGISAWLRKGELEAATIQTLPFDESKFKAVLSKVRTLTATPIASETGPKLEKLFASAGVALIFLPELPHTKVCGATRWLTPTKAIIQLSLRYKTDDQFWFTLFHEAGHILLHPKRSVFLEIDKSESEEEDEANEFAASFLIPKNIWREFTSQEISRKTQVVTFARQIGIAPGIVVGRLQRENLLPYTHFNDLKVRLEFEDK